MLSAGIFGSADADELGSAAAAGGFLFSAVLVSAGNQGDAGDQTAALFGGVAGGDPPVCPAGGVGAAVPGGAAGRM